VKEVVMSGFLNGMGWRPFYNKQEKDKALKIMSELKINDVIKKSFKELSGGQQQKVLLARALCATDNLIFLDEPTNALDVRSRKKFYSLVSELNKSGMTIVMVSHNLDEAIQYATNIIYIKETLLFSGSKEDFVQSEYSKIFNVTQEDR
jgi:zinc transport system ATP-binding protein